MVFVFCFLFFCFLELLIFSSEFMGLAQYCLDMYIFNMICKCGQKLQAKLKNGLTCSANSELSFSVYSVQAFSGFLD